MPKWRLFLFLVLSLLQPILSEHIVIDGRQCSSHSSLSQDGRFNGKYPFYKPISDTLRLRTLRENRQDVHRYGERHGEHDVRFSDRNHLEDLILTSYDRIRNVYERRLYRSERDVKRSFDRDFVHKQRQVIQNNALKRDTSPYARIFYENQEREIRKNFGSNRTPLEARRAFTEKFKIQDTSNIRQESNENWTINLNDLDRRLDRSSRRFRIRQIVKKSQTNENNGDIFRKKVRQRDYTTDSDRDKATDRRKLMTELWERDFGSTKRHQEMRKLFDTNIAHAQYRSKSNRENSDNRNNVRYSRDNVGDKETVLSEGKTYQRDMEQIKDKHITSSLDLSLKLFEQNINQRRARNTPSKNTNVRDGERQSDGKKVTKHLSRSRTEQYDDMRRSVYRYARSNPERFTTVENKLQQDSRRNTHEDDALMRVESNINVRDDRANIKIEKTYSKDKKTIGDSPYQGNLRLQDFARDTVDEDVARDQQFRNIYHRMDTRKQENRVRDTFDRSVSIERDLRQKISITTTSEYVAQRQDKKNTNVRDDRAAIREQERFTRYKSERVIPTEQFPDQQIARKTKSENTAYICEKRNTNIKDDRRFIRKQERYRRDNNNIDISVQCDQLQQNTKRLTRNTTSRRMEHKTVVRDIRRDNRLQERYERTNILYSPTFGGRDISRKNSIRDMDNYNYNTYDGKEQNTNAQDMREHRIHERYAKNIRNIDRYIIDDFGQKVNSDEYQIRYSDVRERQSNNRQESKMNEKNKGTTITDQDWNLKDNTRINSDRRRTYMYYYVSQPARITDEEETEQTSTHNIRDKTITDHDLVFRSRQQRERYVRDKKFAIKNAISLSRYNNYDRSMSLERNVHLEDIRRVMNRQISRSQKTVNTRVLDERRDVFRNYERHNKHATTPHTRRISGAYDTRKGNEQKINKRHVFIIADSNEPRNLTDNTYRSQHEMSSNVRYDRTKIIGLRKNTDVRNTQKYHLRWQNSQKITEKLVNPHEKRSTDVINERSHVEHSKETIMKRSISADRALRQPDNRITDRQIIRNRDELNTLLERNSKYIRERTVSSRVRESDIKRIKNSVERIIIKDELDKIQYNTRSYRNNVRETVTFSEYGTRHGNDRITNKPVAFVHEERTTVSSERIDITNNNRNLRDTINKRTVLSRQERQRNVRITTNESLPQRTDVQIKSEREQTLRDNERRSRYNPLERAVIVERKVPNLLIQKSDLNKEPLRMSNNAIYSRFSSRERTAVMEKKSYLRNERTHNKASNRNTNVWNTVRFVRDNAQERVITKGMRDQIAIRLVRTESSNPTLKRTDERNYLTEGNLVKIGNSKGNLNRIYVEYDLTRRHTEPTNKRNIFGSTKAPENLLITLFYWQYLFYAIQSIYIFGVFMQIFRQKDAKTSSMTWLAATPHIKVD